MCCFQTKSPRRNLALNTTPEYSDAIYIYNQIVNDQMLNKEHAQIESDSSCWSPQNKQQANASGLHTTNRVATNSWGPPCQIKCGRVEECTDWSVSVNRVWISFLRKAKNNWATVRVTLGFFLESQQPQWRGQPLDAQRNSEMFLRQESEWLCHSLCGMNYMNLRNEFKRGLELFWKTIEAWFDKRKLGWANLVPILDFLTSSSLSLWTPSKSCGPFEITGCWLPINWPFRDWRGFPIFGFLTDIHWIGSIGLR